MKKIVAYGPVIVEQGMLLTTLDGKDPFHKVPGGKPIGQETPEQVCKREFKEETGLECEILEELSTMYLEKKPGTSEAIKVELHHYRARLVSSHTLDSYMHNGHEVRWIPISRIGDYNVAPNITFLLENGELR